MVLPLFCTCPYFPKGFFIIIWSVEIIAGYPAPPEFASQVYAQALLPNLVARVTQGGESFDDAIAWAENEAELVSRG